MSLLTSDEKIHAFKIATASFKRSISFQGFPPMADADLEAELRERLGIFAGQGGPSQLDIAWQGVGLKIWASYETVNHVCDIPIFQGNATIRAARDIYKILDPANQQFSLFF